MVCRATEEVLKGEKILLTGPASQVGLPVARALAADNEVHGLARFGRAEDRRRVEEAGVRPIAATGSALVMQLLALGTGSAVVALTGAAVLTDQIRQ